MSIRIKPTSFMIVAGILHAVIMFPGFAVSATIVDDTFYEGAEASIAVRNVVFGQDGARFTSLYAGIDYAGESLPVEGTVEILLRTSASGAVLDTRGADLRLPGDLYLGVVSGPYGSSTLQNAIAGQVFFTIDPGPGTNPGLLPGVLSTTILTDGDWHVISVSFGAGGLALYIDGVLEDTAESITVQPIDSIVTLGDFADQFVPAGFSFLGEILRFRTSDVQNDVTPLCEGMPTLYDNCTVAGIIPDIGTDRFLLLDQNAPNPFNPHTIIAFELGKREAVSLRVFDVSGRLVRSLIDGEVFDPGRHEAIWNGRDDSGRQCASGTYFYRLEAGQYSETKRMVLVK
ncbi:MAG: FlgD immunoglobulin-like domain containing protein [bacterium]